MTLIKTVKSFNAEEFELTKYDANLEIYSSKMEKILRELSVSTGLFYLINFMIFGVGYYFGFSCIKGDQLCSEAWTGGSYTKGETVMTFFLFFLGSFNLLQMTTTYQIIKEGIRCSKELYSLIEETDR